MTRASIDVITELTSNGAPMLRACCGHACGNFVQMPLAPGQPLEEAMKVFLEKTRLEGWAVGLLGNTCPPHIQKMRDQQPRIHRPGGATIVVPPGAVTQ